MVPLKKCLLVTDDPDDHVAFTDAIAETAANTIVLAVLDSQKALALLLEKALLPDYIFLDLSMHAINAQTFVSALRKDETLSRIPTVLYGDTQAFNAVNHHPNLIFFNKDYSYSDVIAFVQKLLIA
ncbi:MAG TPA: hypothetical protein VD927_17535 [Chryseosolibacter sp.]|nr:hypothetical protein [Chryseosolibacter sp.]